MANENEAATINGGPESQQFDFSNLNHGIILTPQKDPQEKNHTILLTPQTDLQENNVKGKNSDKFCFLNEAILKVFSTVGAIRKVYEVHEVLELLEKYLSKNKSLIDPLDPKFINCADTDLGRAFGVDKFEYKDVGKLLSKNVTAIHKIEIPVDSKNFTWSSKLCEAGRSSCNDPNRTCCNSSTFVTITCSSDGIASVPSTSQSSSQNLRKLNTSFKIPVPEIPDPLAGPESEYSYQGYETALIEDSDSDVDQRSIRSAQEEVGEEEEVEEYELASESETDLKSQIDTESDFENIVLILGVEERDDSYEDCFADHSSSSSSSSDSEEHSTEDERDRWACVICGVKKNKPFMGCCEKCFQRRKDWYPDPPKRLRKRKPRAKKDKKRLSCESNERTNRRREIKEDNKEDEVTEDCTQDQVTEDCRNDKISEDYKEDQVTKGCREDEVTNENKENQVTKDLEEDETEDCKEDETEDCKEEDVTEDCKEGELTDEGKEKELNVNCKKTLSDILVKTSSNASTSTVTSTCSSSSASSSMASSQDSGFGSQEFSSLEVYIPRKRKASGSEEGNRKIQKTDDDVEERAEKLAKNFKKFAKTLKGIQWLKSEAGKELLELMQDTSSDSDGEVVDTQDVCSLCYVRPKNASIIHGRLSHIGFCYPCVKRLYNSKSKCPICRRKIHMITKNAYV